MTNRRMMLVLGLVVAGLGFGAAAETAQAWCCTSYCYSPCYTYCYTPCYSYCYTPCYTYSYTPCYYTYSYCSPVVVTQPVAAAPAPAVEAKPEAKATVVVPAYYYYPCYPCGGCCYSYCYSCCCSPCCCW